MVFYFDKYELNLERETLKKDGARVKVEPQVFAILAILIEKRTEIVSRQMLIEAVWQGRNVSNNLIDSRIRSARQAIGDDGKAQRFIKTFTHQGFRFVGAVTDSEAVGQPPGNSNNVTVTNTGSRATRSIPQFTRHFSLIFAVIGLSSILAIFYYVAGPDQSPQFGESETIAVEPAGEESRSPTIAVLPAISESDDPNASRFSMAVAEETISFLGGIPNLNVVSRSSSFAFRNQGLSPQKINDALGVDYRVESKCLLIGDRVAVTVQLINADDEVIAWSKRYEVSTSPDEWNERQVTIARNVAQNITNTLGLSASDFSPNVISTNAHATFTEGMANLALQTSEGVEAAIAAFRAVIIVEPDYTPAYARLYDAYWAGIIYGGMTYDAAIPEMRKVVRQMKVLGPETPEALTAEAMLMQVDGDIDYTHDQLLNILARARAAGPNYALAFQETAHALSTMEQHQQAAEAFEAALILDPVSPELLAGASWELHNAGKFGDAFATANKNIRWNPDSLHSKTAMARLLISSNRQVEAYQTLSEVLADQPNSYAANFNLCWLLTRFGAYEEAIKHAPIDAMKAYIAALADDEQAARNYVEAMPEYYRSKRALYIIGDAKPAYDFLTSERILKNEQQKPSELSHGALIGEVVEAHIYRMFNDPLSERSIEKARAYIDTHSLVEFRTVQQFYGALAFYVLTDDLDTAFEVFEAANSKGFVFLDIFKLPLFEPLIAHPDFPQHFSAMEANAAEMLRKMQFQSASAL